MAGVLPSLAGPDNATFRLGHELLSERTPELAAIEFRRFGMETTNAPAAKASAYLYAGYAYLQAKKANAAADMLDRAEDGDASGRFASDLSLLRGEDARLAKKPDAALYYFDALAADATNSAFRIFARRRIAQIHLSEGDLDAARHALEISPGNESDGLRALDVYTRGKHKRPAIGGLLGLIPGAGYWYSGEIANGFRSLILNSLFIYGMVDTASNDQWGAFAAISFFEVTWYSGSIYGGIDAAHRYNQNRLDTALDGIGSHMRYAPDPGVTIPIFKLNIAF